MDSSAASPTQSKYQNSSRVGTRVHHSSKQIFEWNFDHYQFWQVDKRVKTQNLESCVKKIDAGATDRLYSCLCLSAKQSNLILVKLCNKSTLQIIIQGSPVSAVSITYSAVSKPLKTELNSANPRFSAVFPPKNNNFHKKITF